MSSCTFLSEQKWKNIIYVICSTGDITIPNLIAVVAIFKIDMRLHITNRLPVKVKVCVDEQSIMDV